MNRNSCLFTAAICFAVAASQAQTVNTLKISEVAESATPVVTYNGVAVTLDPGSTLLKDNWTVELPSTFFLNSEGEKFVGEPENSQLVNDILVGTQPRFLTWRSDTSIPGGVSGPFPTTLTITGAGTFTGGATGGETFDLVLEDIGPSRTPDGASTGILLGVALLGLTGVASLKRA